MDITVCEGEKFVEVWLSREESADPAVQQRLRPVYRQYREKGYLVAVFKSGSRELQNGVRDLLVYNRRRCAELAVEQEKRRQASATLR